MPSPPGAESEQEEIAQIQAFLEIMGRYFKVIESVQEITGDPEKSAIRHMHKLQETYEERGEKAKAAKVFRGVLERSTNPTVRNAAYMRLAEVLKETGRAGEAVETLEKALEENLRVTK